MPILYMVFMLIYNTSTYRYTYFPGVIVYLQKCDDYSVLCDEIIIIIMYSISIYFYLRFK